jgi:hypothetical protein
VESERKAVRKCLHHCSFMLLYCVSVECVAKQGLLIRCNCRPNTRFVAIFLIHVPKKATYG